MSVRTAVARACVNGSVMIAADRARVVCSPLHCDRTITPPARAHNMAPIALGSLPAFANTCVQRRFGTPPLERAPRCPRRCRPRGRCCWLQPRCVGAAPAADSRRSPGSGPGRHRKKAPMPARAMSGGGHFRRETPSFSGRDQGLVEGMFRVNRRASPPASFNRVPAGRAEVPPHVAHAARAIQWPRERALVPCLATCCGARVRMRSAKGTSCWPMSWIYVWSYCP